MKQPLPALGTGRTLSERVAGSLRLALTSGYLEPGEWIDQDLIASDLGVSRTPVREALRRLESEGFIEVQPHRGATVPTLSAQAIRDTFSVRRLLESEVVRLITPLIPDNVLDEIDAALTETRLKLEKGELDSHLANDLYFHETLLAYVPNELLKDLIESINHRVLLVRRFANLQHGEHVFESLDEHFGILNAIRQRDAEQAAKLMSLHLDLSSERVAQLSVELPTIAN